MGTYPHALGFMRCGTLGIRDPLSSLYTPFARGSFRTIMYRIVSYVRAHSVVTSQSLHILARWVRVADVIRRGIVRNSYGKGKYPSAIGSM